MQNQIPIFLRLDDSRLLNTSKVDDLKAKLQTLKIINAQGNTVGISEFVKIKEVIKEPTITSKNLNLMINVIAETSKDSQIYPLLDARNEMIDSLSSDYDLIKTNMLNLSFIDKKTQERFDLVFDGELKVTLDTFRDLGGAFIAALVLIFLLLVIYYKSFAISGIILAGSFLSIIGVIIGHFVADIITTQTFFLTATSLIGFIALMGISSRNSLLLIDFTNTLIKEKQIEKKYLNNETYNYQELNEAYQSLKNKYSSTIK